MLFDIAVAITIGVIGLFVVSRLFATSSRKRSANKKNQTPPQQKQQQQQQQKKAEKPAAKEQPAKQQAPKQAANKKAEKPAPVEVEAPAPKLHQQGMSADKFQIISLEDVQRKAQEGRSRESNTRKAEFSQRQRERDEAKGFQVVSKDASAKSKKQRSPVDTQTISQKEQFDRKLNQFFRGNDRKQRVGGRKEEENAAAAATNGGRVAMKSGFGTGRTWGAIAEDN